MIIGDDIRPATASDAIQIAMLSRDHIEYGLHWRWTPARVLASIRDRATNVIVADGEAYRDAPATRGDARLLDGFGIMKYRDDEAHLYLLGVNPLRQGLGIGSALVHWLESAALIAGIGFICVEARSTNAAARAFYGRLGYREMTVLPRYYMGREDAVRLAKDLWA